MIMVINIDLMDISGVSIMPSCNICLTFMFQIDAKRILREIKIMKNLDHENVLGLKDVIYIPREG